MLPQTIARSHCQKLQVSWCSACVPLILLHIDYFDCLVGCLGLRSWVYTHALLQRMLMAGVYVFERGAHGRELCATGGGRYYKISRFLKNNHGLSIEIHTEVKPQAKVTGVLETLFRHYFELDMEQS